ncbi:MAG: DUF58 domain-containing protein [Solirubrobacteraceae bacterium]|nr:DUF58 domain-containing protein [Patulibacter sp.]
MRRGIELALGPVLLCFAASATGSKALFAIAIGLAVVYLGMYLAVERAMQRLVVVRRIDRHEVVEGAAIQMQFDVAGIGGLPAGLERLCACGEWHPLDVGTHSVSWTINQPGPHVLQASPLRVRDDFGLFTRLILVGEPEEILVLPSPAPAAQGRRRGAMDISSDPEPDGLKSYVVGSPVNRIHWKSAARGGELQERAFAPARDHLPLVVVDTTGEPTPAAVDWAARTAAGQMLALARGGGCRVLLPGDRTPTTLMDPVSQWPGLHRRLASLGRGGPARGTRVDLREAVHVNAAAAPPHAVVPRGVLPPGVIAVGEWADA